CDGCGGYMDRSKLPAPHRASLEEVQHLVGNYEELSKIAWIEKWPTENPQRLARRQSNWEEHTDILMHRSAEEFCVPMSGDMTGCNATSDEDYFEHLKKIPFPVLIWEGGLDPLCTAERALKTAQAIPGAQLLLYQHLGHGGADEMPELAARDCDRFFKDTEGRIL
ncbi:MAG: alpha/beta hydrolase, partial [Lachnospiraceae bacterium]|nr:alpha/beta hydrolase [Lachnospiraceae bacterium]